MGLGDMVNKAKEALNSEQVEEKTDEVLDKVADFVSEKTGGAHDDKIRRARNYVDEHLGSGDKDDEGNEASPATGH
ncbi:MAG: antitoxin [Bowdeniella nasicola]|nr:antitoxin [Bowdeniella nasicola]